MKFITWLKLQFVPTKKFSVAHARNFEQNALERYAKQRAKYLQEEIPRVVRDIKFAANIGDKEINLDISQETRAHLTKMGFKLQRKPSGLVNITWE